MFEKKFACRLTELRRKKGVSTRRMSLELGKSICYISDIEARHRLPSLKNFMLICDYLGITPGEYFDEGNSDPVILRKLIKYQKMLNPKQLTHILAIVMDMLRIQ